MRPYDIPRAKRNAFWRKVRISGGCWEWQARVNGRGYGSVAVRMGGIAIRGAHRISFSLIRGPIPPGLLVLHRCDNRRCVRPSHLFLGTPLENMLDMVAKGRGGTGEQNGRSKLTAEKVAAMRLDWQRGLSKNELARRYRISRTQTLRILNGENWLTP